MDRKARTTTRRRTIVVGVGEKAPFWLDHLGFLLTTGLVVLVGGMLLLSMTETGRAALVWIGLGLGLLMAAWLALDPWRSFRAGEPASVVAGEALSALGWSAMTVSLGAGLPFVFWRGVDSLPVWAFALPGAGAVVFSAVAWLGLWMQTRRPLPALDRTPRRGRVVLIADDADGGRSILVRYRGGDGHEHEAQLADLIDDSWRARFAPGTAWEVYAFRDTDLADTVVLLTEAHDDVWRAGYTLDGVRLGGESGAVPPGPGSPFLRNGGRWSFEP